MMPNELNEDTDAQDVNFHADVQMAENASDGSNFHAGSITEVLKTSNFHAGGTNFHAGKNFHAGAMENSNFHAGNFHAGESFHASVLAKDTNFHAGENFHAGNFHAGENFHAGVLGKDNNFHAGKSFHTGISTNETNFHVDSVTGVPAASNFHAGNFHAGNFHAGENFHAGPANDASATSNFHAGNFHAGNLHAGNFHTGENFYAGKSSTEASFYAGSAIEVPVTSDLHAGKNVHHGENFHAGRSTKENNFHEGTSRESSFHTSGKPACSNFHAGGSHDSKNFHTGNTEKQNFLADDTPKDLNFHAGQKSKPKQCKSGESLDHGRFDVSEIINFHAGQSVTLASQQQITSLNQKKKAIETSLSFYYSTHDGKAGFNYVERPVDGIYSNVTTTSHNVSVMDVRGSENKLDIERDAVLCISNIPDRGHNFTNDAEVVKNFYPEIEKLLLDHVPGAQRVFLFDHTIRRKFGDRGPVLRAHIDQTPESALARIRRHLPDEFESLANGRVRLINFWRPINGTVENYPLAFAISDSVVNGDLEPVKHHYPTWTGETYGVRYSEQQKWCYWSGMGNEEALLLQCFDSEKGGRLAHSAILDPTSNSTKHRESIEVRALVFG